MRCFNHRLEKMGCSPHSLQRQPNRPNNVICDGEKSGHRQEPAVTFTRPKLMHQIPEENVFPVPEAFANLKLTSNAAPQTPAFAGLIENTGISVRSQDFRSAIYP